MKKHSYLFLIFLVGILPQLYAQNNNEPRYMTVPTYYLHPPKLININEFVSDLKNKLKLKSGFDILKRDTLLGLYMYTFGVTKNGKVEPKYYYNANNLFFKTIQEFVQNTFNSYRWQPAHRKNCKSCKLDDFLQLDISTQP